MITTLHLDLQGEGRRKDDDDQKQLDWLFSWFNTFAGQRFWVQKVNEEKWNEAMSLWYSDHSWMMCEEQYCTQEKYYRLYIMATTSKELMLVSYYNKSSSDY